MLRVLLFFSRAPDMFLMSSHVKNNWTLLLSSLFHFFYFIFSAPISFSLCSNISPSFFDILSQAFIKCSRKAFVYIYKYVQYTFKKMNLCITKIMTF